MSDKKTIIIGADHGGFPLKEDLLKYLKSHNYNVIDKGTYSEASCDYPDIANDVVNTLISTPDAVGILICGTGIGISIAANRNSKIRAALCHDEYTARMSREHNDANVLALGARVLSPNKAIEILDIFLTTEFSNEQRHLNRIKKMGSVC